MQKKAVIFLVSVFAFVFSLPALAVAAAGEYRVNINNEAQREQLAALVTSTGIGDHRLAEEYMIEKDGRLLVKEGENYTGYAAFLRAVYEARGDIIEVSCEPVEQLMADLNIAYGDNGCVKWIETSEDSEGRVRFLRYGTAGDGLWVINTPRSFNLAGTTDKVSVDHIFQVRFNRDVDAASVLNKFLIKESGSESSDAILTTVQKVEGAMVRLVAQQPLKYGTTYELWVLPGIKGRKNGEISTPVKYTFITESYFDESKDYSKTSGTIFIRVPCELEASSVTADRFTLLAEGQTVPVPVIVNYVTKAGYIEVVPGETLEEDTVYTLTVSDSVKKADGSPIGTEQRLKFATE